MRHTRIWTINLARQHERKLLKLCDDRGGIFRTRYDVDHADRLLPAPQRTSHSDVNHTVDRLQILNTLIRRVPGVMKIQATLGFLHRSCKLGQQTLSSLWTKAFQLFETPVFGGGFQLCDRTDACLVELFDLLDAQSGNRREFDDAFGEFLSQAVED